MTHTCAVDDLLENMMKLLYTDNNKWILKASEENPLLKDQLEWVYEKNRILKDHLERVYEEMQFLRNFLNDSDEKRNMHQKLKQVAAEIRDVAYPVGDIIDSFMLVNVVWEMAGQIFHLLNKVCDCFKDQLEDFDSVKRLKAEMMEILSEIESHVADKISHDLDDNNVRKDIDRLIAKVKYLRKEYCSLLDRFIIAYELGVLHAEKFRDRIGPAIKSWSTFDAPSQYHTSVTEIFSMAETILRQFGFGGFKEDIKMIMARVMPYSGKGLSATWLDSHMDDQFRLLLSLSEKTANLIQKILHGVVRFTKEFNPPNANPKSKSTSKSKIQNPNPKSFTALTHLMMIFDKSYWRFYGLQSYMGFSHGLSGIIEKIKSIKTEVIEIYEKKIYGIRVQQIEKSFSGALSKPTNCKVEEETIVGFHDETTTMMELLAGEHGKQLKLIPIVGMPGLGKTALARKVYNDPLILYRFHIRAWTYVSQVNQKRDILFTILNSAHIQVHGNTNSMSDEELGARLYKALKGNTYLIVMDDIWDIRAWNDLKIYFPNDNNGSRIMFTTRLENVAIHLHTQPHHLRFLNEDESWDLLCLRAFRKETCPTYLIEIGKELAKKCRGLPLAIVVLSGLLAKKDKTKDWWSYVSQRVSSYIISDPEQYMDTLALSYNHLPQHLKPCFLYFGAFPEDYEIPVRQLIWLWIAEGFIRQNEQKSLEEVAEDYLMDLIDRGLTIVSKKRSNGGIKACRVHDLLRDLCLRKAQEDNFLQQISRYEESSDSFTSSFPYRLCIHDTLVDYVSFENYKLYIRSFLSFGRSFYDLPKKDVSFICQAFNLLRVLNLFSIKILFVPKELEKLVHLRYLALHVEEEQELKLSISNLWNLETIIIDGTKGSLELNDIQKLVNLRHVYSKRPIQIQGALTSGFPPVLDNLQTIGKLHGADVLAWFPNLRKLKCQHDIWKDFPKLDFLVHLETLNLISNGYGRIFHLDRFPPNLKSLTLSRFCLPWDQMSTLGSLPNLEILKLSYKAFEGPTWDTSDGGFCKLKFLKLQGLDIKQWNTSNNHFASLQTLVLQDCQLLEKIPSSLGYVSTLEMIQVGWCSCSTEYSARQIQEEQEVNGNDGLKVIIYSLNDNEVVFENVDEDVDEKESQFKNVDEDDVDEVDDGKEPQFENVDEDDDIKSCKRVKTI